MQIEKSNAPHNKTSDSVVTFAQAWRLILRRWLPAVLIPLILNIAIAWVISNAMAGPVSFSQMMGVVGFAPIVLLVLMALGAVIACGFSVWTWVLLGLVVLGGNMLQGATLATTIFPNSVFQPLLIMVAILASLEIFKAIYALTNPESLLPKHTRSAIALYAALVILIGLVCSHTIHDLLYPHLLTSN